MRLINKNNQNLNIYKLSHYQDKDHYKYLKNKSYLNNLQLYNNYYHHQIHNNLK
jgi:hypothetical protein